MPTVLSRCLLPCFFFIILKRRGRFQVFFASKIYVRSKRSDENLKFAKVGQSDFGSYTGEKPAFNISRAFVIREIYSSCIIQHFLKYFLPVVLKFYIYIQQQLDLVKQLVWLCPLKKVSPVQIYFIRLFACLPHIRDRSNKWKKTAAISFWVKVGGRAGRISSFHTYVMLTIFSVIIGNIYVMTNMMVGIKFFP